MIKIDDVKKKAFRVIPQTLAMLWLITLNKVMHGYGLFSIK